VDCPSSRSEESLERQGETRRETSNPPCLHRCKEKDKARRRKKEEEGVLLESQNRLRGGRCEEGTLNKITHVTRKEKNDHQVRYQRGREPTLKKERQEKGLETKETMKEKGKQRKGKEKR